MKHPRSHAEQEAKQWWFLWHCFAFPTQVKPLCRLRWGIANWLSFFSLFCAGTLDARENHAFVLEGTFRSVFAGQPHSSGSFEVMACDSNALLDVTFEHGYREIIGTDGNDSYIYIPFTGSRAVTNGAARATISYGRFPTNAHVFGQVLWMVCVRDADWLGRLGSLRFPFMGDYAASEFTLGTATNPIPPHLIQSIKWYAPPYMRGAGTNRYMLSLYPHGWLMNEMSVSETKSVGGLTVPTRATFTHYKMQVITNAAQLNEGLRERAPSDVLPVEVVDFLVSAARADRPDRSYVPQKADPTVIVDDKRIGAVVKITSGKWWAARELWQVRQQSIRHRRWGVLAVLLLVSILMASLLLRMRGRRKQE